MMLGAAPFAFTGAGFLPDSLVRSRQAGILCWDGRCEGNI